MVGLRKMLTEGGINEMDLEGWEPVSEKRGKIFWSKGMVLAKPLVCKSTRKGDQPIFLKYRVEVEEKLFKIRKIGYDYSEEDFR